MSENVINVEKKYNYPIAAFKLLFLFLIILVHCGKIHGNWITSCLIFFVASGFFTYYLHSDNYRGDFRQCIEVYIRKFKLFFPLHFITFLLVIPHELLLINNNIKYNIVSAIFNLTLTQSWFDNLKFSYNGVAWFLSALLFCYFVSPFYIYLIKETKKIFNIYLLLVIVLFIYYFFEYSFNNISYVNFWNNPFIQSLVFGVGAIVAEIYMSQNDKILKHANFWEVLVVLALIFILYFQPDVPFVFQLIFFCLLVYIFAFQGGCISSYLNNIFKLKLMRYILSKELEIYMIHQVIIKYASLVIFFIYYGKF